MIVLDQRAPRLGSVCLLLFMTWCSSVRAEDLSVVPTRRFAWSGHTGWIAVPTNDVGVRAVIGESSSYLTGFAWSDSIGWISFGNTNGGPYTNTTTNNWGVNLGAQWDLSGQAWAANVGWISFDASPGCRIHQQHGSFDGWAWSEQIGWIRWGAANETSLTYGVSFDIALAGYDVPVWWLRKEGFTNELGGIEVDKAGLDWQAFYEGTDPADPDARLAFTNMTVAGDRVLLSFDSVVYRHYFLSQTTNLLHSPVPWVPIKQIAGTGGGVDINQETNGPINHYRLEVGLDPGDTNVWPGR
jgi:hypothetical protein